MGKKIQVLTPEQLKNRLEKVKKYVRKCRENNKERVASEEIEVSGLGLKNLSNFCYGNSVIQAMFPFREF